MRRGAAFTALAVRGLVLHGFARCLGCERRQYDRNTLAENIFRYLNRRREERDSDGDGKRCELITVQAAADRLAVSRWMVYQLIWDQQVKSVQIGRCRRIVRQSLDDYLSGLIEGAA